MLIGLTGLAGSGKSEVAAILTSEFNFERVRFSAALKNMARTLFRDMGHCEDDVERMIEGDLKESIHPELGVSPRHIMVTLGTEWGRDSVHADLWVRLWAARAAKFENVVVEDVRFPNEVAALRAQGGRVVQIYRPGLVAGPHISERLDTPADFLIQNDGTLDDLRREARRLASNPCA